jgi:threonine-phosphate decarboxylase
MIKGHGGNVYAMARDMGCRPQDIFDMSSNINPIGMPPGLLEYIKDHLEGIGSLPEVDGCTAIEQMAGLLEVDARRILVGNGTTQFIYTACPALGAERVLIVGPTYADYADACRMHDIQPHHFLSDAHNRFEVQLNELDHALEGFDTTFICNPNNPTGRLIPHESLVQLCRSHPGTHFIIDESYLPFVPLDQSQSMVTCNLDNVSVLWSVSKIFGVPGLRAGFLVANEVTIDRFSRFMQPWSLNSVAQAAVGWLGDHLGRVTEFITKSREFLEKEREGFYNSLKTQPQLIPYPSLTSYILMRLPDGLNALNLCTRMGQHYFLIRNCSNFHGLSDQFVRVALKDPRVNQSALEQLKIIVGEWS